MDLSKLKAQVKAKLSIDRYTHTLRVVDTARELAEIHHVPREQVELACLLHDFAKCETQAVLRAAIIEYNLPQALLAYHHEVWHGPVGAMILKHELGIPDQDVYNAVYYHTTGRAAMSQLELIVFVADYTEPARNIPGVDGVRELAKRDIKLAAHQALQSTIMFLLSKGETIYPDTLYAYNELTKYSRSVK